MGSVKWNRSINEKDRVIYIVFFCGAPRKTDLRSRLFLSAQALCGVSRSNRDRQQRTASIARRQAESQSHQPQRDSDSDQIPAVDQPYEPNYER